MNDVEAANPDSAPFEAPTIPVDESERLRQLHRLDVLDTPPEERFDRLTRLACRLFDVPIALVSLVDESRQWFKSRAGLDATETPRDVSFCGHAILDRRVFIVANADEDPRFANNPLVTGEPYVKFYAGVPLLAPGGQPLGTLCIIDHEARDFAEPDLASLRDLAAMAEQELAAVQLATRDELTGIANRRGFFALAESALHMSARIATPTVLAYFDLDGFKTINDRFGHAAGDTLLTVFAKTMQQVFRDSDIFARIGGDEFVALLANTSLEEANNVISRFRTKLTERAQATGGGDPIAFSCGLVEFDADEHGDIVGLVAASDNRMFEAKRSRRTKHESGTAAVS